MPQQKLMICSDIHDDTEALEQAVRFAQARSVDHVLVAGDFLLRPYSPVDIQLLAQNQDSDAFMGRTNRQSKGKLEQMKSVLDAGGMPYTVIPGNYDCQLDEVFGDKQVHKKVVPFANAKMLGYGGADAFPPHIDPLARAGWIVPYNESELEDLVEKEKPDIVLVHNPPHMYCDTRFDGQHVGSRALRRAMVETTPKLIVCGHIHEAGPYEEDCHGVRVWMNQDGKTTTVVNPGNVGRWAVLNQDLQDTLQTLYGSFVELVIDPDGTPRKITQYSILAPERKIKDPVQIGERTLK